MRAELTVLALAHEPNRYLLTRLVAKATRKLHRPNTRLQDTMNDALERLGRSKPKAATALRDGPAVKKFKPLPSPLQPHPLPITKLGAST
jgi:hypothetical protein